MAGLKAAVALPAATATGAVMFAARQLEKQAAIDELWKKKQQL